MSGEFVNLADFFEEAARLLAEWKSAQTRLDSLVEPYNRAIDAIRDAQKDRTALTVTTGTLAELADISGAAGDLRTLEGARAGLANQRDTAMRRLRAIVVEETARAFAVR